MKKTIFLFLAVIAAVCFSGCDPDVPVAELSVEKAITGFGFKGVSPVTAEITGSAIEVIVPYETDISTLVATFTSTGASVTVDGTEQVSGTTANDFSYPVTYTVTAEDGSTYNFTVLVYRLSPPELPVYTIDSFKFTTEKDSELLGLTTTEFEIEGEITGTEIDMKVEYAKYSSASDVLDVLKSLTPVFETTASRVEVDGVLQESGETSNNFTDSVVYRLSAGEGVITEYRVNIYITVTRAELESCINASDDSENEAVIKLADVTGITNMYRLFYQNESFNVDISRWDVGNVTSMEDMFYEAKAFNADIGGWDVGNVTNMHNMFYDADSFNRDIDEWDITKVTDMTWMFAYTDSFNGDIGGWDIRNVPSLSGVFQGAKSFNSDISSWDVSHFTDLSNLFRDAESFNQDIGGWDVSHVTDIRNMFNGAASFNQDIGSWDVGNVLLMGSMFSGASSFNGNIGSWNVSNVTVMQMMFEGASSFNQDIGGWNVGSVVSMIQMFNGASSFNQDIGSWDVGNVQLMNDMFSSAESFNQDIGDWDVYSVGTMGNMFQNASSFCQDLSDWDTPLIQSTPSGFNDGWGGTDDYLPDTWTP